jgi:hypothetical protein
MPPSPSTSLELAAAAALLPPLPEALVWPPRMPAIATAAAAAEWCCSAVAGCHSIVGDTKAALEAEEEEAEEDEEEDAFPGENM